jgi:nicotinamidase-related amidase
MTTLDGRNRSALLVIDMQNGVVAGPGRTAATSPTGDVEF